MGNLNWSRYRTDRILRQGKQYEADQEWKQKRKYSTYRNGNFYIGNRLVEKYRMREKRCPGDGLFFNQEKGRFEAWRDAECLSSIPWKKPWQELINWAHKFGFQTHEGEN